jgi:hypothetical protein
MRLAIRSFVLAFLVIVTALLIGLTETTTAAFTLAATTVLVTTWQGDPLSTPPDTVEQVQAVLALAVDNFVAPAPTATTPDPTGIPAGPYNAVAVVGLPPLGGDQARQNNLENIDNCIQGSGCIYNTSVGSTAPQPYVSEQQPGDRFIVGGYSEATTWATLEKRALAAQYPIAGTGPQVSFMLLSNLNRPNGGVLARGPEGSWNPLLGVTANGSTPTDTQYKTVDITRQYDGASDAVINPLNGLAVLNANIGFFLLHGDYNRFGLQPGGGAVLQDQYGDTTYYMIPTTTLPLLIPLSNFGTIGFALADMWDPALRVMVEAGYNRTISPGQPTEYDYTYFPDPTTYFNNLNVANRVGMDNLSEDLGMGRPLGTTRPDLAGQDAYGVGGPPVTMSPTTNQQQAQQTTTLAASVRSAPSPAAQDTSTTVSTASESVMLTAAGSEVAGDAPASSLPSAPTPTTLSTGTSDMTGGNKVSPGASTSNSSSSHGVKLRQVLGSVRSALKGLAGGGLTNSPHDGATDSTASAASDTSPAEGPAQ